MKSLQSLIASLFICLVWLVLLFTSFSVKAQQDPQYTQYVYNTMSVNPAYTGQREVVSITGLYRKQWVGLDGAPETQTFGIHSPLRYDKIGLGLSVVRDQIGPASETYFEVNSSYRIDFRGLFKTSSLSFGLKAGVHLLNTDWSKGEFKNPNDVVYQENISQLSPLVGIGLYFRTEDWYLGISTPNMLRTDHYNDLAASIATEQIHYYFIGGYVYQASLDLKLKPAFLIKAVNDAPLIADVSLNALIYDKFVAGISYRLKDAVSGLVGFQISESIFIGYSYDATMTNLSNYSSGTHEITLRFEFKNPFDESLCGCPLFF